MMHDHKLLEALDSNIPVRPASTVGPLGERLTKDMLPPPNTRWTPRRKAEVVAAVHGGLLDVTEACRTYNISLEEFDMWARGIARAGLRALRVTHVQTYRKILASDV
ncbi:DUF1153 domain-containing protein [Novosphingobium sp. MW5]|nr:DUF1153 domain-containing protein [Novosphingobium sp. MW5]